MLVILNKYDFSYQVIYASEEKLHSVIKKHENERQKVVEVYDLMDDMDSMDWNARSWKVPIKSMGASKPRNKNKKN